LVHEAYLRLVDEKEIDWQNRAHFFGVAAVRMRHILVERARSRRAAKRGGGGDRLTLSEADRPTAKSGVNLIAPADAPRGVRGAGLGRWEALARKKWGMVKWGFWGGLTIKERGEGMKIPPATVKRDWSMARAWLRSEISNE